MATTGNAVTRKAMASPVSVHRTSRRRQFFFTLCVSTARILETVVGLVLDRRPGLFLLHARLEAAALDHEPGDDTVKNEAVEKAIIDVGEKIFGRNGSFFLEQLHFEVAQRGFEH
jgi:hypothetical protein